MNKSPPTLGTWAGLHSGPGWDDYATLHRRDDGGGLLYRLKAVRRGSLAELIRHVMMLPETERRQYAIEKSGDHRLELPEIRALANRPDFPSTEGDGD